MADQDPAALLADVDRALRWCGFLIAVMLLILVIDLQLKRSIARTAIIASGRHDSIVKMADGLMADLTRKGAPGGRKTGPADSDSGHSGGAGADGLAGDAPVAAAAGHADGTAEGVPAAAPAGPRKRPPGNGRRASRADT